MRAKTLGFSMEIACGAEGTKSSIMASVFGGSICPQATSERRIKRGREDFIHTPEQFIFLIVSECGKVWQ
jgi:hypothetical protein